MTQSGKTLLTALVLILLAVLVRADATKRIVLVRAADVALHADPDTTIGRYYTLSYALPGGVTSNRLDRAILELFVNVTVKTRDGFVGASPLLEVYALSEPFSGRFEIDAIDQGRRALRPVALGEGRRVVVDITDIVRAHLEGRIENNGLVLGSLTGMREGEFMFESGRLSGGAVGRLLIFERDGLARAEADAP